MKRLLLPLIIVLAGCSPSPADTDATPASATDATSASTSDTAHATDAPAQEHEKAPPEMLEVAPANGQQPSTSPRPEAVAAALRTVFNNDAGDARYFHQAIDLDGDGRDEIIAHVAGPLVCGSGGCDTVVLTADSDGYRVVADIGLTRPPISAAATSSNGWRDLLVTTGGGGGESGPVLLRYDGTTYPTNPTVEPAKRLSAAPTDETVLIKPFDFFAEGTLLETSRQGPGKTQ